MPVATGFDPAAVSPPPGWESLSMRILRGLVHDLRGRAMALDSVQRLVTDDTPPGMEGEMDSQIARLKVVVELVALVADEPDGEEQPLAPSDGLDQVMALWRHGIRGPLEPKLVDGGTAPPILVDWVLFRRVLLSCMARVQEAAPRAEGGGLVVTLSGDSESTAEIELRWTDADRRESGGGGAHGGEAAKGPGDDTLPALADAAGRLSGALSWRQAPDGGLILRLRLPSLAVRRSG